MLKNNGHNTQEKYDVFLDALMPVKEAAKFLSISLSKTYEMISSGELQAVKLGGSTRIQRKELYRLINANLVSA